MLDRNKLDFFFELAGQTFRGDAVDEVVKLARENIDQLAIVEWHPVISIVHKADDGHPYSYSHQSKSAPHPRSGGLDLSFERYERGKFDGKWKLKRKHILDIDPEDKYETARRARNDGTWLGGEGTVIPYTEESWRMLHRMIDGIHDLNAKLTTLLEDDTKAALIFSRTGMKLLPFIAFDTEIAPATERRKRR